MGHLTLHGAFVCTDCHALCGDNAELLAHRSKCVGFSNGQSTKKKAVTIATAKPLKTLQKRIAKENAPRKHVCNECGKSFKSGQSLGGHRKSSKKRVREIHQKEEKGKAEDENEDKEKEKDIA